MVWSLGEILIVLCCLTSFDSFVFIIKNYICIESDISNTEQLQQQQHHQISDDEESKSKPKQTSTTVVASLKTDTDTCMNTSTSQSSTMSSSLSSSNTMRSYAHRFTFFQTRRRRFLDDSSLSHWLMAVKSIVFRVLLIRFELTEHEIEETASRRGRP